MSEIAVAVMNRKGGVGKTTISIILAELALMRRKRVLAIDLDPQGNFSAGLSYLKGYFKDKLRIKSELDTEKDSKAEEEWVIIDCPPHIDENIKGAINFSDIILVPVRPDLFSIISLDVIFSIAKKSGKSHNQLPIVKVGYDDSRISKLAAENLSDKAYPVISDFPLYKNIPYNIAKGRIWAMGLTAAQREPYEEMFIKINNAYFKMKNGDFENAWGNKSIRGQDELE